MTSLTHLTSRTFGLAGCGGSDSSKSSSESAANDSGEWPQTITDVDDHEVTIDDQSEKIVSKEKDVEPLYQGDVKVEKAVTVKPVFLFSADEKTSAAHRENSLAKSTLAVMSRVMRCAYRHR